MTAVGAPLRLAPARLLAARLPRPRGDVPVGHAPPGLRSDHPPEASLRRRHRRPDRRRDVAARRPGRPLAADGARPPAAAAHAGGAPAPGARDAPAAHRAADPSGGGGRGAPRRGPAAARRGHRDRRGGGHPDDRRGQPGRPVRRCPGPHRARRAGFGVRAVGAGAHRAAGSATAVRPRTRRISDRPVDRAELPLHRVDLRPALPLSDLSPTPAPSWACRRSSISSWPAFSPS